MTRFQMLRGMLDRLVGRFGRQAMSESPPAKMTVLQPLVGRYVQIGYGTKTIQTYSGIVEAGDIDGSGVTLRQTENDHAIRLFLPDIQWVVDATTGQEWYFA